MMCRRIGACAHSRSHTKKRKVVPLGMMHDAANTIRTHILICQFMGDFISCVVQCCCKMCRLPPDRRQSIGSILTFSRKKSSDHRFAPRYNAVVNCARSRWQGRNVPYSTLEWVRRYVDILCM